MFVINLGVPAKPSMAQYTQEEDGIMVKWKNGADGGSPILGYVIEGLGGTGRCYYK